MPLRLYPPNNLTHSLLFIHKDSQIRVGKFEGYKITSALRVEIELGKL